MGIPKPSRFVHFGPFRLDLRAAELRRNGAKVRLPDQSIKVLTLLVESSGEVVTREELHRELWPNGTIVEFDGSINAIIRRLREALEDSAGTPQFIETLPRRGYRFLVPVIHAATTESVPPPEQPVSRSDGPAEQTISHYRLVRKLGQGAMGVVYLAEDLRLGRSVAIKFLPEELSDDPRALERFAREAQAASALNHPNIYTVYEVDEHQGVRFIVMEYVAGKSLDEMIGPKGLPLDEVLSYSTQIADGLAKAHSAGIVHRDLKPSNIMVSQDGLVKLLDFGLARTCVAQSALDLTAPAPERPLTGEGTILGTLQYMAPEQLEGREADARTDIFALGAVIHEMATGRKAFEGKSQASLIAAILEREPLPISSVGPLAVPALDRVVATCLGKKPDARWQSARDLLRELQWLKEGREPRPAARTAIRSWSVLPWALFAAASLALVVFATFYFRQKRTEPPLVRFQISLPANGRPWEDVPAVSPDGHFVVLSGFAPEGKFRLWIHSLDSPSTRLLPGTEEGSFGPFWSPDSRSVAFFASENSKVDNRRHFYLRRADVSTGLAQTICETQAWLGGGSWSRDGVILFSQAKFSGPNNLPKESLYRVSAEGGEVQPVLPLDNSREERSQIEPQFLPDGRHFLYRSVTGSKDSEKDAVYVGSLDSRQTRLLTTVDSNAVFVRPGFLVFGRQETLLAQPFDAANLKLVGEAVPLATEPVARQLGSPSRSLFSASQNGVLVYLNAMSSSVQLAWYKRDGARLGPIGEPGPYDDMRISSDETNLVLDRGDAQTRLRDLWTVELSSGIFTRLTFGPGNNIGPEWSPNGKEIAFSSDRRIGGLYDVYRKAAGGGDEELLLASNDQWKIPQQWLRDGSILLEFFGSGETPNSFYRLPASGERKPVLLFRGNKEDFREDAPIVSSDERCAAYESDESGRVEVYVATFPLFQQKRRVSENGGGAPLWRKDGKELFFVTLDGRFMSVSVKCGPRLETGVPKTLFQTPFRVDLHTIVYCVTENGNKFILSEPIDNNKSFTVVLNWTEELKH